MPALKKEKILKIVKIHYRSQPCQVFFLFSFIYFIFLLLLFLSYFIYFTLFYFCCFWWVFFLGGGVLFCFCMTSLAVHVHHITFTFAYLSFSVQGGSIEYCSLIQNYTQVFELVVFLDYMSANQLKFPGESEWRLPPRTWSVEDRSLLNVCWCYWPPPI
jgi:hypothetical protein